MALIQRVHHRAREIARRTWMKYALRGVHQNDAHERLDLAYQVPDPWHMDADREQFRFAETCRVIKQRIAPRFGRVLEVGCGEGHQSLYLNRLADTLTGIDVSATAVERARKRLPSAEFLAGDLFKQDWADERGRFDLVTACEVVMYMSDIPGFLHAMDRLGRACVVTWYSPASRHCAAPVRSMPGAEETRFRHEDGTEWVAAWWKGAAARGRA